MKKLKIALAAVLLAQGAAAMAGYQVRIPVKGLSSAVAVTPAAPAPTYLSCNSPIGELLHGTTQTAYSRSIGSSPQDCASASTQFSCNNGVLTSSNSSLSPESYGQTSCSVMMLPPPELMQVEVWNIHGYDPVLMTALNPSVSATNTGLYPAGYTTVDSGNVTFGMADGTCYRCQLRLYQDGIAVAESMTTKSFESVSWSTSLTSGAVYQLHITSNGSDWPGPLIQVR